MKNRKLRRIRLHTDSIIGEGLEKNWSKIRGIICFSEEIEEEYRIRIKSSKKLARKN